MVSGRGDLAAQWELRRREVSIIDRMVIDMHEAQVRTLEQVRQMLVGTQVLEFRWAESARHR